MRLLFSGLAALALTGGAFAGGGDILWDNDIIPNGFNARAVSPPAFPDIRVADDFIIRTRDNKGWSINDLHVAVIEDVDWITSGLMEVTFYDGGAECPGPIRCQHTVEYERMNTGDILFDREVYLYWAFFPTEKLPPGRYWVGFRDPQGDGVGTNYWLTSDGGQGAGSTGCFSLDGGATWQPEGKFWEHAFQITGAVNCNPCKGDINGDCVVSFDDLLQVLSAWGPCPSTACPDPGVCPDFPPCDGDGCACFMMFDGNGACVRSDTSCNQPVCLGGQGDCPPGWKCLVESCCDEPVCVPPEALCGTSGPSGSPPPSGTRTISGIQP